MVKNLNSSLFLLYSTSGCHLCEQAVAVLNELKCMALDHAQIWDFKIIDIADDVNLFERYGVRIPVLVSSCHQADLGWPFDAGSAQAFIQSSLVSCKGYSILDKR